MPTLDELSMLPMSHHGLARTVGLPKACSPALLPGKAGFASQQAVLGAR